MTGVKIALGFYNNYLNLVVAFMSGSILGTILAPFFFKKAGKSGSYN